MTKFSFTISATDGNARRGVLRTAHGDIQTPAFMPVGTAATVKGMTPEQVDATGADIILGNTYHLMLRPSAERIHALGGLHKFMNWHKPILTDSGGFQVMSLAKLRKITEDGVTFQSHIDGSSHHLTPERAIAIQHMLGSTITMAFDECTPYPATEDEAAESMRLSMRWAERSRMAFMEREGYGIFGIVQGSVYEELRVESAKALREMNFHGMAIGGLAVGEGQELMFEALDYTVPHIAADTPRYLMGVGTPEDIVGAVERGIDMFDCVIPTRSGRNARAYTHHGVVNMRNARHMDDMEPLDASCHCPVCTHYGRAYLHHLFRADEMLGPILLTWHNLFYYQTLMRELRDAIAKGALAAYAARFRATYNPDEKEA
ncbi:MAG: tRNA guanosine(34) transglycosylase Tgt [Alphaproteobacteria bacterium]|nr:tRNA guanosine(34) transglycosylase Tgt [Alphaproteobacteria bacterium]